MTDEEFLKRLRQVCRDYDRKWGEYPESKLEGWAIFAWVTEGKQNWEPEPDTPDDWPRGEE